jgi:hypothetical protein
MSVSVKNAAGATVTLKSTTSGSDEVMHHLSEQSGAWSVTIAGLPGSLVGYAEDSVHSSGHVGLMTLVVRSDAGGTLAGTDGDYAPLQVDANGALRVTGGGGGTEYTEDAAAASDPVGTALILVRADSPAGIVTANGDNVAQRGTNYGAAFVQVVTSSGAFVDSFGGGTQYAVDAALGGTPTGTLAVAIRDDALSALSPVEGDAIGLRVNADGALWVIPESLPLPTGAATESTLAAIAGYLDTEVAAIVTAVQLLDNAISGSEVQVDIVGALPAGANVIGGVTQSGSWVVDLGATDNAVLDDMAAKLGTIDADTSALAGAVAGTEVQVDIVAPLPAGTNAIGKLAANSGVDIGDVDVTSCALPTGAATETTLDALKTAAELIDDAVYVDDAGFTPGTSKVIAVGLQADETATDSVNEGDVGAPRMTLDRKVIVTPQPHTGGGLSVFRSLDLDETEEDVKTSPGCLYKLRVTNRTASVRYVKLYNDTAANVTVGTTTPLDTIPIPANASDYTVLTENFGGMGLAFSVALSIAATTGFADNDTGAPGLNDLIVSAYFA